MTKPAKLDSHDSWNHGLKASWFFFFSFIDGGYFYSQHYLQMFATSGNSAPWNVTRKSRTAMLAEVLSLKLRWITVEICFPFSVGIRVAVDN